MWDRRLKLKKMYEKNLKTLAHHYQEMDKMIREAKEVMKTDIEVIKEESNEGNPI